MKLSDIGSAGLEPASRTVEMKVAGCDRTFTVGLRLLTAAEQTAVYRRAKESAASNGADRWDQDDPVCALELYVETIAACAYDVDDPNRGAWATAEELRANPAIGQENLVFLYDVYTAFADENSIRPETMGPGDLVKFCIEAVGDQNDFLDRLRPGTQRTLLRFLAVQYLSSLQSTSRDSTGSDSSSESESKKPTSS